MKGQQSSSQLVLAGYPGLHQQDPRRSLAALVEAAATPGRGEFPALTGSCWTTGAQDDVYT